MASLVFSNMVANPLATNPVSLNLSLTSKGVIWEEQAFNAKAILFNNAPVALTNTKVDITVQGNALKVDTAYNGVGFAVLSSNNFSSIFTVDTGTVAQTPAYNGLDSVSLEKVRLWNLNG